MSRLLAALAMGTSLMLVPGAVTKAETARPVSPHAGSPPSGTRPSFIAHHQVEAEVSRVDRDAGVLLLKTAAGPLRLDAGRAATALRKGDRVLIDLTLIRHSDPARVPRDERGPRPLLVQRLAAEVMSIQRGLGVVALKTPVGRLDVDLPLAAIAGLRTGDRLPLELAIHAEPAGAALPRMDGRRKGGLAAFLYLIFGRPQ